MSKSNNRVPERGRRAAKRNGNAVDESVDEEDESEEESDDHSRRLSRRGRKPSNVYTNSRGRNVRNNTGRNGVSNNRSERARLRNLNRGAAYSDDDEDEGSNSKTGNQDDPIDVSDSNTSIRDDEIAEQDDFSNSVIESSDSVSNKRKSRRRY